eukprot:TRINITY_DN1999_c0_g1_i4.p3 TRINITY_DN1999_c0_g1~~TRINITY_DN1999_c0_g1_i4.p3  ORF type:complete len:173 (+),score=2.27 TRINITY_DN1999_c0_g1_i4:306-824(+)
MLISKKQTKFLMQLFQEKLCLSLPNQKKILTFQYNFKFKKSLKNYLRKQYEENVNKQKNVNNTTILFFDKCRTFLQIRAENKSKYVGFIFFFLQIPQSHNFKSNSNFLDDVIEFLSEFQYESIQKPMFVKINKIFFKIKFLDLMANCKNQIEKQILLKNVKIQIHKNFLSHD